LQRRGEPVCGAVARKEIPVADTAHLAGTLTSASVAVWRQATMVHIWGRSTPPFPTCCGWWSSGRTSRAPWSDWRAGPSRRDCQRAKKGRFPTR
jgi:hypothetical protein